MSSFKVLIAGAGLGGLTLAQSLRRAGVDVSVFDRDSSPWDRPQGYRLHLDADALNAAREVLTEPVYQAFQATAQRTEPYTTILSTDLAVIKRLPTADEHDPAVWPDITGEPGHANVDRSTLRQILLTGLGDDVHFNKKLIGYDSSANQVSVRFADGSQASGDVLVGADGIRSTVRGQRAPDLVIADAGITAIYGRIPAAEAGDLVPAEVVNDIFAIASDERKVFLGLGSVKFPMAPPQAATLYAPEAGLRPQEDYLVCIVGGRHGYFPGTAAELRSADGPELGRVAAEMLRDWPSRAGAVIDRADPEAFFVVQMYTSVPGPLEQPSNVTLLGDAIHAMTPTLGRGANLAMRDGALLGRHLTRAAHGQTSLVEELTDYEKGLTDHSFAVVREAAAIGQQRMAQNPLPA